MTNDFHDTHDSYNVLLLCMMTVKCTGYVSRQHLIHSLSVC